MATRNRRSTRRWLPAAICSGCAASLYLFGSALAARFGPQPVESTSPDGRIILTATPGRPPRLTLTDNRTRAEVPLRTTARFDALLKIAGAIEQPQWQPDGKTCSVLVRTGDTRRDRIVLIEVGSSPVGARVVDLEGIDD